MDKVDIRHPESPYGSPMIPLASSWRYHYGLDDLGDFGHLDAAVGLYLEYVRLGFRW